MEPKDLEDMKLKKRLEQLNNSLKPKNKKPAWLLLPLLFVFVTVVFTVKLLQTNQELRSKAAGENASLELNSSRTVTVGEAFTVPVMVNTDGVEIVEADIVIEFDKTLLSLSNVTTYPDNSSLKTFVPQKVTGGFDMVRVRNTANETGRIEFGAINFENGITTAPFNGVLGPTNPLALLQFTALTPGQTDVNFVFTAGSTVDANLIKTTAGSDTLGRVTNLQLTINGLTPTPGPSSTPSPTPVSSVLPSGDVTPPQVQITNPADGAIIPKGSQVNITAEASDENGVSKVEFIVDGKLEGTDNQSPYTHSGRITGKPGTSHTISAKAYDNAGNTASYTVTVSTPSGSG